MLYLISIEWAALLNYSILLLEVVISCVLQRIGSFIFGTVGAPYWKVGITLPWTIPISVSWCTVAEKSELESSALWTRVFDCM